MRILLWAYPMNPCKFQMIEVPGLKSHCIVQCTMYIINIQYINNVQTWYYVDIPLQETR